MSNRQRNIAAFVKACTETLGEDRLTDEDKVAAIYRDHNDFHPYTHIRGFASEADALEAFAGPGPNSLLDDDLALTHLLYLDEDPAAALVAVRETYEPYGDRVPVAAINGREEIEEFRKDNLGAIARWGDGIDLSHVKDTHDVVILSSEGLTVSGPALYPKATPFTNDEEAGAWLRSRDKLARAAEFAVYLNEDLAESWSSITHVPMIDRRG